MIQNAFILLMNTQHYISETKYIKLSLKEVNLFELTPDVYYKY